MKIVPYKNFYAREIADLYHASVHGTAHTHYSTKQLEAWAPTPPDYAWWGERLSRKKPFLALEGGQVVGFIELEADGHIDCLYTHKDFQRRGVAGRLYRFAEEEAIRRGLQRLYVEASLMACPFFEKRGYTVRTRNQFVRRGVELVNFTMEKNLSG